MIIPGTKYQSINPDKKFIVRVVRVEDDKVILSDYENKITIIKTEEYIKSNYIMIRPDAFLNIMTTIDKKEGMDPIYDVIACINKIEAEKPDLILRQNMLSVSRNVTFNPLASIWVGDCLTTKTMPPNDKLDNLLEFTEITNAYQVAIYITDILTDITKCIDKPFRDACKKALKKAKEDANKTNAKFEGFQDNLIDLFKEYDLIGNFRSIYNINSIDFPIDINNYDDDGNIVLNKKQKKKLEDILRKHISDIHIIKYDRDIDISKIVSYHHIMVSDSTGSIYLIAFTIVDDYPIDNDIVSAFNFKK